MYVFFLILKGVGASQELKYLLHRQPKRMLTEEEVLALRPFAKPERSRFIDVYLRTKEVHEVFGTFEKLLIRGRGLPQTEYYFSGMRVVVPYDSEEFMGDGMTADVAVTRHYIVPLSTDLGFNLVESARRLLESQLRERQAKDRATVKHDFRALATVEEISRRRETAGEVQHLKWWDRVWLFPVVSFVAVHLIGGGRHLVTAWDLFQTSLGSLMLIGAFFFYVLNLRVVRPKRDVRDIKGWLFEIRPVIPFGDPERPRFHLGTEVVLDFPKHWRDEAKNLVGKRVQLSVSERGGRVLAIKGVASLESEELTYPLHPWGGHVSALVIGCWLSLLIPDMVRRGIGFNPIWACVAAFGCAVFVIAMLRLIKAFKSNRERKRRISELRAQRWQPRS